MRPLPEAVVEETRQRLSPEQWAFQRGDRRNAEKDLLAAIDELDRVKDQLPDWAYNLLAGFALKAAHNHERRKGDRSSYRDRNIVLAETDSWLRTEHGVVSAAERRRIICEALRRLGHDMKGETLRIALTARRVRPEDEDRKAEK
jgi:hypothetical protein